LATKLTYVFQHKLTTPVNAGRKWGGTKAKQMASAGGKTFMSAQNTFHITSSTCRREEVKVEPVKRKFLKRSEGIR
jgi:hypothetical protein